MGAKTISFPKGKGHLTHNNRDFISKNVVPERTSWNRIYMNKRMKNVLGRHLWIIMKRKGVRTGEKKII